MVKGILFVEYPTCSTCRKAKRWLDENGVPYLDRHIVDEAPTAEELRAWSKLGNSAYLSSFDSS